MVNVAAWVAPIPFRLTDCGAAVNGDCGDGDAAGELAGVEGTAAGGAAAPPPPPPPPPPHAAAHRRVAASSARAERVRSFGPCFIGYKKAIVVTESAGYVSTRYCCSNGWSGKCAIAPGAASLY